MGNTYCPACKGNKYTYCKVCKGNGYVYKHGNKENCRECSDGKVVCNQCNGTGKV